MSRFVFSLFLFVSFFVFLRISSPEVSLLRAIVQIYLIHALVVESRCSLSLQDLVSLSSQIWSLPSRILLHINTTAYPPAVERGPPLLHLQGINLICSSVYEAEEASVEEEPLLLYSECRICRKKNRSNNPEALSEGNGSLKYAYRKGVQRWNSEIDDITCGICHQPYQYGYGYTTFSPLTASHVLVLLSCSAILARFVHRGNGRGALHPFLNLSRVRPEDHYLSLENLTLSSLWERSTSPLSSDTERIFPPYSSTEETFGVQPQNLPLPVDAILPGFKTRFLLNSTELEPTFQSVSIKSVMVPLPDEHVDFYEILQIFRDLKKCLISIFSFHFNHCLVGCYALSEEFFGILSIFCTLKV